MGRLDPHSWNDSSQPDATSIDLALKVDFAARRLEGAVTLSLSRAQVGPLDLDTRDLEIRGVSDADGGPLPFTLEAPDPIIGARLRVQLGVTTRRVRVDYRTSEKASALQWLTPSMTAGGKQPYLFSQCQAIHARSIVPVQDTPRVRITYTAELTVPRALRGLMAAAFVAREEKGELAVEKWSMPQAIPPYLIAFAVGELESRDVGPRSRVWAEPSVVEAAAREFDEVDRMIGAAEALFGPYDWDRFDLLCMPPSFPYGGMENPRLTFLTPTLLAGDCSLTAVVAHELAHSWTGNLVSNASAEHFWLNEGFTVYAERRIVEALYGADVAALQAALGRRDLDEALARFAAQPALQRLHTPLTGIDPDEAFSEVPYEKGFLFLRTLEEHAGRASFDWFLRAYLQEHAFRAITSDDFCATLERELPGAFAAVDGQAWLEGAGVPKNAPEPKSTRLDAVRALGATVPAAEVARKLTPTEWQLYLDALPRPAAPALLDELDRRFALTKSTNYEILVSWLQLGVESGHAPVLPRVEEVLAHVGRMKYLKPLYTALAKRPETKDVARRIFEQHRAGYHPIAQQVIAKLLGMSEAFDEAELEQVVRELRALAEAHGLPSSWPAGASVTRIAEAEQRAGGPFSNEYRALLTLHDGLLFDDLRVLSTADFIDGTQLYTRAREFIEEGASFGTTELLECVPVANLGQPNDWLMQDLHRAEGPFVVWLNADDLPLPSLAAALRRQAEIARRV